MTDAEVAVGIARRIASEAVWDGGECNWIGSGVEVADDPSADASEIYRALDESLYDGTAGVGVFLAEVHALDAGPQVADTARGALRHAVAVTEGGEPTRSLYSGSVGVALAAARGASVLDDSELTGAARRIALRAARAPSQDSEADLLLGAAGGVLGLVTLAALLDQPELLSAAQRWAGELLRQGDRSADGLSWASEGFPEQRNLTGYSHGTAGIAHALLELHAADGDARWLDAATAAFEYERAVFDPEQRNWPDFREKPGAGRARSFATFWCHGAPGIALSRVRAIELGAGGPELQDDAAAALATTRASVELGVAHGRTNYSLCHGLAGNAEALAEGGDGDAADTVARAGASAHGDHCDFPCGTLGGQTPGLFLGLAGIGHFYLRRAQPGVPSVVLVRPGDWAATAGPASAAAPGWSG